MSLLIVSYFSSIELFKNKNGTVAVRYAGEDNNMSKYF